MEDRALFEKLLDTEHIVALASQLVSIESHRDAPDRETACARRIAEVFAGWGMEPELVPVLDGRPNIYCTLKGSGDGPSLMLNGHTDTVPGYDMDFPPFAPFVRDGYLHGRGAVDMKGPIACMMMAMKLVKDSGIAPPGDIIFSGVINEEDRSEGAEFLVRNGPRADACIVGEPTSLAIMPGHRGLEWLEFEFTGKAAHGGTPEKGINAISMASRFIHRVEEQLMPELARRSHPLLGHAVMNFGTIRGGTQPSTVADSCIIQVDRRWLPSERLEDVLGEYAEIIATLKVEDPSFHCAMKRMESNMATMDHYPLELPLDHPLLRRMREILRDLDIEPAIGAFGGWTDASLLSNFAGIPSLVFGPGDLSLAHSRAERVSISELRAATLAYALMGTVP